MQRTNLVITVTNLSGKKETATIAYVNNDISNDNAKKLAQALVDLTNNTYTSLKKTTSEEVLF